jgi:hypothetical protein
MHHVTLTRCLTVLGLSACSSTVATEPRDVEPSVAEPSVAEPSGLDMQPHAPTHEDASESRFVPSLRSWCDVAIDTHARKLEPTPSFLQAWNIVAANGQRPTRYLTTPPHTEDDARVRVCGRVDCTIEQPQIFQAMIGGGAGVRAGTARVGFGVVVPSEQGPLVVPVVGVEGSCAIAPELRVARSGSLVHVTAIVHEGDYNRTYFHGEYGGHHGGYRPMYDGCATLSSSRTDIIVDVATARLELVLTQPGSRDQTVPLVEVTLAPRGVELRGCADVLEIAWSASSPW